MMPSGSAKPAGNAIVPAVAPSRDILSFGPFRLVPSERLLTREGAAVDLGARALDILIALISRPNEVITKKDLLSRPLVRRMSPQMAPGRPDRMGRAGLLCPSKSDVNLLRDGKRVVDFNSGVSHNALYFLMAEK